MNVLQLLRADGSITVNKYLARTIGLHETIILCELISRKFFYEEVGKLDEEGMFFCTIETLEENTTLSKHQQNKAIKNLESYGIIKTVRKGLPAKRYFTINESSISMILSNKKVNNSTTDNGGQNGSKNAAKPHSDQKLNNSPTSRSKIKHTEGQKFAASNNKDNNNNLINDDDDFVAIADSLFNEIFFDRIDRNTYNILIAKISKYKDSVTDFKAYIAKSIEKHLTEENRRAEKSILNNEISNHKGVTRYNANKTKSKPVLEMVRNEDIEDEPLDAEAIQAILKEYKEISEQSSKRLQTF